MQKTKTTNQDKAKINARFQKSTLFFLSLTDEQFTLIEKDWCVDVEINNEPTKFKCSSTDKMAYFKAKEIRFKQKFSNNLKQ